MYLRTGVGEKNDTKRTEIMGIRQIVTRKSVVVNVEGELVTSTEARNILRETMWRVFTTGIREGATEVTFNLNTQVGEGVTMGDLAEIAEIAMG